MSSFRATAPSIDAAAHRREHLRGGAGISPEWGGEYVAGVREIALSVTLG